jgi:STE24 endopeptidase
MAQTIFYIIFLIVVLDFVFEQWLDYLNTTHWSKALPEELKGIYDEDAYAKSQAYKKANRKFGMITSSFSFIILILMLLFDGFALLNNWAEMVTSHYILQALFFFAIIGIASDILTTPFDIYDTFVIEEKFGFNKSTPKIFVADKIKGWLVAAILGGGILALIMWIWNITGNNFWWIAWSVVTFLSVFMSMFYSQLIVPLFNKQTPLPEGELKTAIIDFAKEAGFSLKNIYVIDGSKRSTKANAYFTGLGPKKRIVLYDTLIDDLETQEIVAVLAHEIGHYKKKHTTTGLLAGIVQSGIMLYVFSLMVSSPYLSQALGVEQLKFYIGLIAFAILYSPLSFIMGIGMNIISRKNEYQAEALAAGFGLSDKLSSALKKLSVKSLSNLTPHPAYVFFHYSHPTLLQRLRRLI